MKKTIVATLSAVMLVSGLGACTQKAAGPYDNTTKTSYDRTYTNPNPNPNPGRTNMSDVRTPGVTPQTDMTQVGYYRDNDARIADDIKARAERISGVRNVNVVMYGNDTVLVGCDTSAGRNDAAVRNDVRRVVQNTTNRPNVVVVTDPSLNNRIRNASTDLRNGRPVNQVNDDIRAIINDVGGTIKNALPGAR